MSIISRLSFFVLSCVLLIVIVNCTKVPDMQIEFGGVSVDLYSDNNGVKYGVNISKRRKGTVSTFIRIPF